MSHVFLSHVHEDAERVARLALELTDRGATVWLDKKDLTVGEDWKTSIRRAIENGIFFVACFSNSYLGRERSVMNFEIGVAVDELAMRRPGRKWFLPLLLDPIDKDIRELWVGEWERLGHLHHTRLYDDWNKGVAQLIAAIEPAEAASVREAKLRDVAPAPRAVEHRAPVLPVAQVVSPRARWRVEDTQQQKERAQEGRITTLAFSPSGEILASCAAAEEEVVRIWGVPDLTERDAPARHAGLLSAIKFSPDGAWIATAGDDLVVRVSRVETGKQRWSLPHPEPDLPGNRFIPRLAFNESGGLLATASPSRLRVWDLSSGKEIEGLPEVAYVRDLVFAPFERVVATAEGDGAGRLRDALTGQVLMQKPGERRGSGAMARIGVSADGHLFATVTDGGDCQVWDTKTGREVPALRAEGVSHVAFSRGRRLMAAAFTDGTLRAWELDGGKEVLRVKHAAQVLRMRFRPDGGMLATVGKDWLVRLVDIDEPGEPFTLDHSARDAVFSPDGRLLATGDRAIVLWGPDSD